MTPAEESAAKKQYAELLVGNPEPLGAALELYPNDTTIAAWIAVHWSKDPEVIAHKKAFEESQNAIKDLPDKVALSRVIWDRMQGIKVSGQVERIHIASEDLVKLGKLYAEINSFIEKPSGPNVVAQIIVPKVIEIPHHGSDEEWEAIAERQQKDLLSVSRTKT